MLVYDIEDFYDEDEDSFAPLDEGVINLHDPSDPAYSRGQSIPIIPGMYIVTCHGNLDSLSASIYVNGQRVGNPVYTIEDICDELLAAGWTGEEIALFACHAGEQTILSPAQELADMTLALVWAPNSTLWVNKRGKYYVSPTKLSMKSPDLKSEVQRQRWYDFLPITY